MHLHSHVRWPVALLATGLTLVELLAAAPTAVAAPRIPGLAHVAAYGQPKEISKVTLGDVSSDGLSLWTSPTGDIRAELSWISGDADTAHHLSLMSSSDGVTWSDKSTSGETSNFRPAMTRFGPASSDNIVQAWTGSDANQSLNVSEGHTPWMNYMKLTLWNENSFTSPGVAVMGKDIYLAWAGTDANHSLNVDHIVQRTGPLLVDFKVTLKSWSSITAPTLSYDPVGKQLLMSWIGTDKRIHFATSSDGKTWTQPKNSPISEWSDATPDLFAASSTTVPGYWMTWRGTGTDKLHHINVAYTQSFPSWPLAGSKGILDEMAFGGPEIGYIGVAHQTLLAWVGTDKLHHINAAIIES